MANAGSTKNTNNQTGFTSVRGPGGLSAGVDEGLNAARNQFSGFSPESAITTGARGLAEQTIAGDFLNPSTNPHLQGVANLIGDNVFNQTQQRFGGAGRNVQGVDAEGQFRSDLTNQLSPLFADNFARERGIQANTMFGSSQFDPLNQFIQRTGLLSGASQDRDIDTQQSSVSRNRASPLDTFLGFFG